ncbi:hypothetical protein [Roseateles sp.]|uniref:hypothetical protein n=1 Tax=Roseateles sp. TaxID=1971397 RepID=UPI00286AFFD3|nr:hypothetical protein [Roseateles sp.]
MPPAGGFSALLSNDLIYLAMTPAMLRIGRPVTCGSQLSLWPPLAKVIIHLRPKP